MSERDPLERLHGEIDDVRERVLRLHRALYGEDVNGRTPGALEELRREQTGHAERISSLEELERTREVESTVREHQSRNVARLMAFLRWALTMATSGGVLLLIGNIWRAFTGGS